MVRTVATRCGGSSNHGDMPLRLLPTEARESRIAQRAPDLVITEIFMPGWDGIETLLERRKAFGLITR